MAENIVLRCQHRGSMAAISTHDVEFVLAALTSAGEAERERCARIADEKAEIWGKGAANAIAAAIRAGESEGRS